MTESPDGLTERPGGHAPAPRPSRGFFKIAAVATLLGIALGALITFVSRDDVNDLRHRLTLTLLIEIVAIINVSSFLLFILFWSIYRWIKRDLEPRGEE